MSDKFRNNFISIENNGISYANRNGLFFTSTSSEYKIIWNEKVQAHTCILCTHRYDISLPNKTKHRMNFKLQIKMPPVSSCVTCCNIMV